MEKSQVASGNDSEFVKFRADMKVEFAIFRKEMRSGFAGLRNDIVGAKVDIIKWMFILAVAQVAATYSIFFLFLKK
jgi:hypothetical protein